MRWLSYLFLLLSLASNLAAQGAASSAPLELYDSSGVRIGPILDWDDAGSDFGRAWVAFDLGRAAEPRFWSVLFFTEFISDFRGDLLFATSDCTGTPYYEIGGDDDSSDFVPRAGIFRPGKTLYTVDFSVEVDLAVRSQLFSSGECQAISGSRTGWEATALFDLESLLTPPFRVWIPRATAAPQPDPE